MRVNEPQMNPLHGGGCGEPVPSGGESNQDGSQWGDRATITRGQTHRLIDAEDRGGHGRKSVTMIRNRFMVTDVPSLVAGVTGSAKECPRSPPGDLDEP